MDRIQSKRLFLLGAASLSLLATAGCHHGGYRGKDFPPSTPLAREGGSVQFNSDPHAVQAGMNAPAMPGGGPMGRGGVGAGGPGAARSQVGDPPTVFGGEPEGVPKSGEMTMPAGAPNL